MSAINDGGPAFPDPARAGGHCMEVGMTLRDYFAAKAMQGWLSSGDASNPKTKEIADSHAKQAYQLADAMLLARDAKP